MVIGKQQFIDEGAVEELFGIRKKTLQRWRTLNVGPKFRKFGVAVRYAINDLEEWSNSVPAGGGGVPRFKNGRPRGSRNPPTANKGKKSVTAAQAVDLK